MNIDAIKDKGRKHFEIAKDNLSKKEFSDLLLGFIEGYKEAIKEQFKAQQKQSAGVIKNVPEKIYLQTGLDIDEQIDEDFKNLDIKNICWSSSKVFETDIEYTLTPQKQLSNED